MFGFDEDGYDYHCYSCGKGYYNEVGWGPMSCSRCGGPIEEPKPEVKITDEQYAETMIEFHLSMDSVSGLKNDEHINLDVVKKLLDKKIKKLQRFRDKL